jgi:hypothetical protein
VKNNVCLLMFLEFGSYVRAPFCHPPDGASGIPTSFGNGDDGENPSPVPGHPENGTGCGFPITLRLEGISAEVQSALLLDGAGKPVAGTFSSPQKPAHPWIPTNGGCSFFIPSKPLSPNTTYKVTFKPAGDQAPMTWSFATGK